MGLPNLCIVAGGGLAPRQIIEACRAQGRSFFVVCLQGQADPMLAADAPHAWLPLGAAVKLRDIIRREALVELVMIGHVRRPSLRELKPDWLAMKVLARIGINMLGDDGLLRAIGHAMEQESGVRVIGAQDILGGLLTGTGLLAGPAPDAQAEADIARGIAVARLLGQADTGQSVVVQQGIVLGVEAAEGTDALIARCAALHRDGPGGVLVKLAKPQQDDRFDLPSIGPGTMAAAARHGLRGIAVEAGRSLLLEPEAAKRLARDEKIFLLGIG